jgi:hypothetical protein
MSYNRKKQYASGLAIPGLNLPKTIFDVIRTAVLEKCSFAKKDKKNILARG